MPRGDGCFFEAGTVGAVVVWDEVSWYVPKGG